MTDLGEAPLDTLRRLYIDENPHPLGDRDQMLKAEERGTYHFRHGSLHPYFSDLAEVEGHYDIFLISLSGDLLYTLEKEDDFATNLQTGPYAGTHLAESTARRLILRRVRRRFRISCPMPLRRAPMRCSSPPRFTIPWARWSAWWPSRPTSTGCSALWRIRQALGATGEAFVLGGDGAFRTPSRAAELFAPETGPGRPRSFPEGQWC